VKGDIRPLAAVLADQPDTAEVARQERGLMADRRQRLGELRTVDVLGTVPGMEGGLTTTVRLTFERGIATNLYTWGPGGRVVDIGARPYQSTALVAVGEREFQTMQVRGTGTLHLRIDGPDLVARLPHGSVRLTRVN